MKNPPNLALNRCNYIRLQALNWMEYGLASTNNVQARAGDALASLWNAQQVKCPLVVNCTGVATVADHALEAVRTASKSNQAPLIFFSATLNLAEELRDSIDAHARTVETEAGSVLCIIDRGGTPLRIEEIQEIIAEALDSERAHVSQLVADCYKPHEDRLTSTPLKASGVFNARKLICQPSSFVWITLSMVDALRSSMEASPPRHACLLSVSLRASPFAAAVGFLYDTPLEVEIVDHMGPHYAILETDSLREVRRGLDYIYIGDFLIGGTELKLAHNYALNRACRLRHAVVIGSWLKPEEYRLEPMRIKRLVSLPDVRAGVTYTFN